MGSFSIIKKVSQAINHILILVVVCLLFFSVFMILDEIEYAIREAFYTAQVSVTDIASVVESQQEDPEPRYTQKEILPDDTIHLVEESYEDDKKYVYDVNGKLLWEGEYRYYEDDSKFPYEYLHFNVMSTLGEGDSYKWSSQTRSMKIVESEFYNTYDVYISWDDNVVEVWRFHPYFGYFTGYGEGRKRIGYLGASGFVESKSEIESFGELIRGFYSSLKYYYSGTNKVYEIDFKCRTVEVMHDFEEDIIYAELDPARYNRVESIEEIKKSKIRYRPYFIVQTEDGSMHIKMLYDQAKINFELPSKGESSSFSMCAIKDKIFFKEHMRLKMELESPSYQENKKFYRYDNKIVLYKLKANGNLEKFNEYSWSEERSYGLGRETDSFCREYLSALSPVIYPIISYQFRDEKPIHSYHCFHIYTIVELAKSTSAEKILLNIIVSLLLVILVVWHSMARRLSWSGTLFWVVIVGLFTLPGFTAYLMVNNRPVIKCSSCGKKRHLLKPECIRCGAKLPRPEGKLTDLILA